MMRRIFVTVVVSAALAACQPVTPLPSYSNSKSAALRGMEQVAIAAHKCWIASKDPAFRAYQLANELNAFSGTPRFLLVPASHHEGRPLLVVQASGPAGHMEVFGPLMNGPLGTRIGSDVARWRGGNPSCGSVA